MMGTSQILQPAGWPRPRGYSHGMVADGRTIFLAGQIGWDERGRLAEGLAAQVGQALVNVVTLLAEAGGRPSDIVRLTWWVTDLAAYRAEQAAIGAAYRQVLGKHFPAMSVVQVAGLLEPGALVEIEATAVLAE